MGQNKSLTKQQEVLTPEIVNHSIEIIFDHNDIKFQSPTQVIKPLARILKHLEQFVPANQTTQGFLINLKMIKIMYHKKFLFAMSKLITLLMETLEHLMTKNTLMITRQQWKFCLDLTNFIIFFSDDKIIRMVDSASVRTDIHYESKELIQSLQRQGKSMQAAQYLIDKFSTGEVQRIEKCLRISLNTMINLRLQVLTRSKPVLGLIRKLQQSCFILYLKAIYSSKHSHQIMVRGKRQFLKTNLIIGQYFLGCGSDSCKSSVYQSAVIFLYSLMQNNKDHLKDLKALPSHLFKNLPIISQNTAYDFIANICLFSLCYIKEGANVYTRLSFNRIMTLKLVDLIVKQLQITSPQITYYLQELSIQTRAGQIQRAFVSDLVENYRLIISETVNLKQSKKVKTKQKKQDQSQKVSRYSREVGDSKILQKFTQASKINYNIKYSNKSIKVTPIDVVTQLQNDQNTLQIQFKVLCEKYIYEVILNKKMLYQYSDRQIWSEILERILDNRSQEDIYEKDNSSDDSPKFKIKMIREEEKQKQKDFETKQQEKKPETGLTQSKINIVCEVEDLNDQNISVQQDQEPEKLTQENHQLKNLQDKSNDNSNDEKFQNQNKQQSATEEQLVIE